jgi:hypothetical protein
MTNEQQAVDLAHAAEVQRLQEIIAGLAARVASQAVTMSPLYFVWRPTKTGWRADHIDPDGEALAELSLEAALARIEYLKAAFKKRTGNNMEPEPLITLGARPKRRVRKEAKEHRDSPVLLNGHSRRHVPEEMKR